MKDKEKLIKSLEEYLNEENKEKTKDENQEDVNPPVVQEKTIVLEDGRQLLRS